MQILNLFTKENITFIIAILGFGLSVYNFTKDIIQNRFKIDLKLKAYVPVEYYSETQFMFKMCIENKSKLPVSISRIILHINSESFDFDSVPHPAYSNIQRTGKKITNEIHIQTISVPQTIPGLGILGDFFYVITNPNILPELPNNAVIEIITNRGNKKFLISNYQYQRLM